MEHLSVAVNSARVFDCSDAVCGDNTVLCFPRECIVGTLGDASRELASGTEVAEEFVFVSLLTFTGAMCSGKLKVKARFFDDTRLYTVLLADSAFGKKSSALCMARDFLREARHSANSISGNMPNVLSGAGSGEGLALVLRNDPNTILTYDELRGLTSKAAIEGSSLLNVIASLFHEHDWHNPTRKESIAVEGANLSLLGCATTDTYEEMWSPEAIRLGFPNRLFVVTTERKQRVALPPPLDTAKLTAIRQHLMAQLDRLPLALPFEGEAAALWTDWYEGLPNSIHAKRLDTIGLRLAAILALTTDKQAVDVETVQRVITILNYELRVRQAFDPVDADNAVAKMEQQIIRQLSARGSLKERELRQYVHAYRTGFWVYRTALKNLRESFDVQLAAGRWSVAKSVAN